MNSNQQFEGMRQCLSSLLSWLCGFRPLEILITPMPLKWNIGNKNLVKKKSIWTAQKNIFTGLRVYHYICRFSHAFVSF